MTSQPYAPRTSPSTPEPTATVEPRKRPRPLQIERTDDDVLRALRKARHAWGHGEFVTLPLKQLARMAKVSRNTLRRSLRRHAAAGAFAWQYHPSTIDFYRGRASEFRVFWKRRPRTAPSDATTTTSTPPERAREKRERERKQRQLERQLAFNANTIAPSDAAASLAAWRARNPPAQRQEPRTTAPSDRDWFAKHRDADPITQPPRTEIQKTRIFTETGLTVGIGVHESPHPHPLGVGLRGLRPPALAPLARSDLAPLALEARRLKRLATVERLAALQERRRAAAAEIGRASPRDADGTHSLRSATEHEGALPPRGPPACDPEPHDRD